MTPRGATAHAVTLIPGDGIGPEVIACARRVLDATGVRLEWDVQFAGAAAFAADGVALPHQLVESIRTNGAALKGPVATPAAGGFRSVNIALRQALDLYLGVRPCRTLHASNAMVAKVDVVVVRMTGEDLYAGLEFAPGEPATTRLLDLAAEATGARLPSDTGVTLKPISHSASLRAARGAFNYARAHGRAAVAVVHKATVMRATDGVFLDAAREAAIEFPDVRLDDRLIDAVCHDLVVRPDDFDVLLAPVMYGDLLADLCAGLTGGLGLAPGASYGDTCAVFEPVHGTAERLAGTGRANPMAAILSGAMLLRHLGESRAADRVESAVEAVARDGSCVTYDLMPGRRRTGAASTEAVAEAVITALA